MQQCSTLLSTPTIARLISGYGDRQSVPPCTPPTSIEQMAGRLRVTFRPLPKGFRRERVARLREAIRRELLACGVDVVPWEDATTDFHQVAVLPVVNRRVQYRTKAVREDIHAVIDVQKPATIGRLLGIGLTETVYWLHRLFNRNGSPESVTSLARLSLWAEDHALWHMQDYIRTQAITLAEFDARLLDRQMPYAERIPLGLAALADAFSPVVVGVCGEKLSVLNLNLSDSVYDISQIGDFVFNCLIPKLYLPIIPMLAGQFDITTFDPRDHDSARRVVELGRALEPTGLLPDGHRMGSLLKRRSRRDIARVFSDGRTGVSFGFVAHVEPPQYVGPAEIAAAEFQQLETLAGYDPREIRRSSEGRHYVPVVEAGDTIYRQIPDIWIASSRSGARKTDLDLATDVVRVGSTRQGLHLQLPHGSQTNGRAVKPSYDLRVMLAIAVSAALHRPELIERGAGMFHFHGYPHQDWFLPGEGCAGRDHPSVPCGTLESGVLNFQGFARLAAQTEGELRLAALIEPDHGTNLIAPEAEYLAERVRRGVAEGQLTLGSRVMEKMAAQKERAAPRGRETAASGQSGIHSSGSYYNS